jgi:nucleoside-diphosphate-sugar epimerase
LRIFVAGGTGVLGGVLVPELVALGHHVTATTRSISKAPAVRRLGAGVAITDALDGDSLYRAVEAARPDAIVHLLTDLSTGDSASNARLRTIGTRNLVEASRSAGVVSMVAESISWVYPPGSSLAEEDDPLDLDACEPRRTTVSAVHDLETAVAQLPHSVVLRFGQLYGPGTWFSRYGRFGKDASAGELVVTETVASFVHASDAVRAILLGLEWESGIWNIVDDDPAAGTEWAPQFATAVDAPRPVESRSGDPGRPVSNGRARNSGLVLRFPSWRAGFQTL